VEKRCVGCGANLSGRTRTKDDDGNYVCRRCRAPRRSNAPTLGRKAVLVAGLIAVVAALLYGAFFRGSLLQPDFSGGGVHRP
jgi:hypothetical protein